MDLFKTFVKSERQVRLLEKAAQIAQKVEKRVKIAEETASMPIGNVEDLRAVNYMSLTLPKSYGGEALSLYEFLLMQERLAAGDGATALSVGWHLGVVKELSEDHLWNDAIYQPFAKELAEKQLLVNRLATEPATGSPTRGGIPETKAKCSGNSYLLNGRKTFASMASVLDYYIVTAYIEDQETVGSFLIAKDTPGISIEHTWDTLGMRGTGSDDVILKDVTVAENMLVELHQKGKKPTPKGWLLHIPACYLGIAIAARNDAIEFAKNFQPNSLNTPISEVAHIQQKIGEMDLKLMQARYFMYSIAERWDNNPEERGQLGAELAAVKTVATNSANEVVDLAMRIVGGRGLSKENRFEQYYRDVRAGLHNPPMDDMVISILAKRAVN
ncbi:acyl-CoA dehydrogenase family protein [Paraliobacillus zengyii]|uniref:acyl-CoA dehydrogenase family protein n=1 Tax=Paraliobacillus zengyii TaxID=2213194 RepID=UPI000E3E65D4|nr:acyl-CoA dehydrogenase family protein [Paraliobacillus zengyii]